MATLVFDLGGVVIEWDPVPAVAVAVGRDRAERFVHGAVFDFSGWNHAQDAGRSFADAEAAALADHPELAEEITAYRTNFAHSLRGLVEGTNDVLRDLAQRGHRLVALTNWSAETFHHAPKAYPDVFDLFAEVVVSGVEGIAKPDPEIFDRLGTRLGRPIHGLFYTDDREDNVRAARAAGMDAVPFTGSEGLRVDLGSRGLL